jgi:hypothetical protein
MALRPALVQSNYCDTGKIDPRKNPRRGITALSWKKTAEVKEIEHHSSIDEEVHAALWYSNDEWTDMELRNSREAHEEKIAAKYGYAKFHESGYYEYFDASAEESENGGNNHLI